MIHAIVAAGFLWTVFAVYWAFLAYQDRHEKKERDWMPVGIFAVIAILLFAGLQMVPEEVLMGRLIPDDILAAGLGVVKLGLGLGFAVWARLHLADQWTAIPAINEEHRLIRTGPYKYLRHPIYAGVLGGLWGTAVIFGNLAVFILMLVVFVGFVIKAYYEERLLEDEMGDEYLDYKSGTKMLIPFIL